MKTEKQIAIENGLKIGAEVVVCEGTCFAEMITVAHITEEGFSYSSEPMNFIPFGFWYGIKR